MNLRAASPESAHVSESTARLETTSRLIVRAALVSDLGAALALVGDESRKNEWVGRIPELFGSAVRSDNGFEYRAVVGERDSEIIGFAVYGGVAGTVGTGMLYGILVGSRSRRAGVGTAILRGAIQDFRTVSTRMIIAEIPKDAYLSRYRAFLNSNLFFEEARIEDYYRDGVDLIISRRNLTF